jgi:hypothetical protein
MPNTVPAATRPAGRPGTPSLWDAGNLLLQKFPAPEFRTAARVDGSALAMGDQLALVIMGQDYAYISLERTPAGFRIRRATCRNAINGQPEHEDATADVTGPQVDLWVDVNTAGRCMFSYAAADTAPTPLGGGFVAREGRWIGAKVGLVAFAPHSAAAGSARGHADIDWFHFLPPEVSSLNSRGD